MGLERTLDEAKTKVEIREYVASNRARENERTKYSKTDSVETMADSDDNWPIIGSRVERLTLFSDAIFAFAMTLLAVDIRVPEIPQALVSSQLTAELVNASSKIIGYGLSFFILASYWVFYHRIFAFIKRYDQPLVWLNILFLFFVALVPFPSDLIGRFFSQEVSIIIYSVVMALTGSMMVLIWRHASNRNLLLGEGVSKHTIRHITIRTYTAPLLFFVSIPASFVLVQFTPAIWLLSWPLGWLIEHYI